MIAAHLKLFRRLTALILVAAVAVDSFASALPFESFSGNVMSTVSSQSQFQEQALAYKVGLMLRSWQSATFGLRRLMDRYRKEPSSDSTAYLSKLPLEARLALMINADLEEDRLRPTTSPGITFVPLSAQGSMSISALPNHVAPDLAFLVSVKSVPGIKVGADEKPLEVASPIDQSLVHKIDQFLNRNQAAEQFLKSRYFVYQGHPGESLQGFSVRDDEIRNLLESTGFSLDKIEGVSAVTVLTQTIQELMRNIYQHSRGGDGVILLRLVVNENGTMGVELIARDNGSGIGKSLGWAMSPGNSTGSRSSNRGEGLTYVRLCALDNARGMAVLESLDRRHTEGTSPLVPKRPPVKQGTLIHLVRFLPVPTASNRSNLFAVLPIPLLLALNNADILHSKWMNLLSVLSGLFLITHGVISIIRGWHARKLALPETENLRRYFKSMIGIGRPEEIAIYIQFMKGEITSVDDLERALDRKLEPVEKMYWAGARPVVDYHLGRFDNFAGISEILLGGFLTIALMGFVVPLSQASITVLVATVTGAVGIWFIHKPLDRPLIAQTWVRWLATVFIVAALVLLWHELLKGLAGNIGFLMRGNHTLDWMHSPFLVPIHSPLVFQQANVFHFYASIFIWFVINAAASLLRNIEDLFDLEKGTLLTWVFMGVRWVQRGWRYLRRKELEAGGPGTGIDITTPDDRPLLENLRKWAQHFLDHNLPKADLHHMGPLPHSGPELKRLFEIDTSIHRTIPKGYEDQQYWQEYLRILKMLLPVWVFAFMLIPLQHIHPADALYHVPKILPSAA